MAMSMTEKVQQGAKLLDRKRPGWAGRVEVEILHMSDCQKCVLGQLFSRYHYGTYALALMTQQESIDYGFTLRGVASSESWIALTHRWRCEISERRNT